MYLQVIMYDLDGVEYTLGSLQRNGILGSHK